MPPRSSAPACVDWSKARRLPSTPRKTAAVARSPWATSRRRNAVSKLLCDELRIETAPNGAVFLSAPKEDRRSG